MVLRQATGPDPAIADVVARLSSRYRTVGQMTFEIIRECILAGVFAPGERLRQEELAERIGVSRIPVRTALMQLESEGLVSFHPHRGAVVRSLTVEQVREIYELRLLLEVHTLHKSISRMTSARAATLRELGAALDENPSLEGRVAFYRELYDAAENPAAVEIIEDLRNAVGRYLLGLRVQHPHGGHRELARLAARGDAEAAETHLREHLALVRAHIIQAISEEAESPPPGTAPSSRGRRGG